MRQLKEFFSNWKDLFMINRTCALVFICLLFNGLNLSSQEEFKYKNLSEAQIAAQRDLYDTHQFDLGFGLGMDYGGLIGAQMGYSPIKYLDLFGSIGYALINVGWEFGVRGYFVSKTKKHTFRPYGKAMYGYNAVIVIEGASEYNKIYYGPTVGAGVELRFGREKVHGFNIDINVPIRSDKFNTDFNELNNNPNITEMGKPLPIAISMGYHMEI